MNTMTLSERISGLAPDTKIGIQRLDGRWFVGRKNKKLKTAHCGAPVKWARATDVRYTLNSPLCEVMKSRYHAGLYRDICALADSGQSWCVAVIQTVVVQIGGVDLR